MCVCVCVCVCVCACVSCFGSLVGSVVRVNMNGWGFGVVRLFCIMRDARLSRLVVMSICLDESRSCSVVGHGGRFMSDVVSIVSHLVAIGVTRGSGLEELCVSFFRCSGDLACRILWK